MGLYQHRLGDNQIFPGAERAKIVCVGRNYAAHAQELNNPLPQQPLLFIKPATALAVLEEPIELPPLPGRCDHELEIALLIGQPLCRASEAQCLAAVVGVGLALDLTLRDLQQTLKDKGHPWERAKAFDGACPLSRFVPAQGLDFSALALRLVRNGQLQQQGSSADMLFPVATLLADISHSFTLLPGDVVLTGTPAGVGPLQPGDTLEASLGELLQITTRVSASPLK